MNIQMNLDECKSYATEENLNKALKKFGFDTHRHVVARTRDGRWTAIFPQSNIQGGYLALYACKGFFTLG